MSGTDDPSGPRTETTDSPTESSRQAGDDEPSTEVSPEAVHAPPEEAAQYRESVHRSANYEDLETAPEGPEFPHRGRGGGFRLTDLPRAPSVKHIVGPGAIMLGASLGSGETLFWPTLVAQHGWAVYWAFLVGVITQFFINTELQRWTIATGESVFRAFERIHGGWPLFFLLAGFLHLGWPGWVAGAAEVVAVGTGLGSANWPIIGVVMLVVILLSYLASPVLYTIIERAQLVLMVTALATAVVFVSIVGSWGQLRFVPSGVASVGFLPPRMDIAVFLGGLAYAGAGGYINLSQSLWIREKGYGMGVFQGRVTNVLRGMTPEPVYEDGFAFPPTRGNLRRFRAWWRVAQREHVLTFVLGLLAVATIMMTISAQFAAGTDYGAIDMWLLEVAPAIGPAARILLFVVLFLALFTTQYAIVEVFVRNSADILYELVGRDAGWNRNRLFLGLLTGFVGWGILVILARVQQPWILLVLGAAIAGVMMWPYVALVTIMNATRLPEPLQPGWIRLVIMWWATGFFGYFSVLLVGSLLATTFGFAGFATTVNIVSSPGGGQVLWIVAGGVQAFTMVRSAQGKLAARGTVPNANETAGLLR